MFWQNNGVMQQSITLWVETSVCVKSCTKKSLHPKTESDSEIIKVIRVLSLEELLEIKKKWLYDLLDPEAQANSFLFNALWSDEKET